MIVLAGDIGGTHARIATFDIGPDHDPDLIVEAVLPSADYPGPAPIVRDFLRDHGLSREEVAGVCVAVAGPITNGVFVLPNLGWTVELSRFGPDIGIPGAILINDFEAVGHGVPLLKAHDIAELQQGSERPGAPIAIIGPGTGLGHAFLIREAGAYTVHPSEGGHADFAPTTPAEWEFAEHLRERYGHASWERVVSGPALVEAYNFFAARTTGEVGSERPGLSGDDAAGVIAQRGMDGSDALCGQVLDTFMGAWGAQAGNLALTVEAYGGVYLAGGIAPKLLDKLRAGPFLDAFRKKGRLSSLLAEIPIRVIMDDSVGLKGAANVARRIVSGS